MKSTSTASKTTLMTVSSEYAGRRLDVFLTAMLAPMTRTRIKALIDQGNVIPAFRVKNLKAGLPLVEGQSFNVIIPALKVADMPAQAIDLDILFEDSHILVINKPVGMVVHPGAGNPDNTLINALLAHCPKISGVGGVQRPGLVHRLDKDTSGLLVAAKSDLAYRGLVGQLKNRELSREYLGIVKGCLEETGVVDAPIGRHAGARKKMAVRPEGGKDAVTHFRALASKEDVSLLHLKLETGRTHQIRVHMAYIHHPILGDTVYGKGSEYAQRQMLHAFRLSLKHPKTGVKKSFMAPPPRDFADCLKQVGLKAPDWKKLRWV